MDKRYLERTLLSTQPTIALRDVETEQCVVRFLTLGKVSNMQVHKGYVLVGLDGVLMLYRVYLPHPDYQDLAIIPYVLKRIEEETNKSVVVYAYGKDIHRIAEGSHTVVYLGTTRLGQYEGKSVSELVLDELFPETTCSVLLSELPFSKEPIRNEVKLVVSEVFTSHTFVGGAKALQVRVALGLDEFLNLPYAKVSIVFESPVAFTTSFFVTLLDGLVKKGETVNQFLQRVDLVGIAPWLEHLHEALDEIKLRQVSEGA